MKQVFAAIAQNGLRSRSSHKRQHAVKRERGQWKRFLSPGGPRVKPGP
jgi:hypothetical protein